MSGRLGCAALRPGGGKGRGGGLARRPSIIVDDALNHISLVTTRNSTSLQQSHVKMKVNMPFLIGRGFTYSKAFQIHVLSLLHLLPSIPGRGAHIKLTEKRFLYRCKFCYRHPGGDCPRFPLQLQEPWQIVGSAQLPLDVYIYSAAEIFLAPCFSMKTFMTDSKVGSMSQ